MTIEPEMMQNQTKEDDPIVIAYRWSGPKALQGVVRVRRSQILKDPSLVEISSAARAQGFDAEKALKRREKPLPPDLYVLKKIQQKLLQKDVKTKVKKENITLDALKDDLSDIQSIDDPAAQKILELVTNQLKFEGLWIEDVEELAMSEAFPLSQAKSDPRFKSQAYDFHEYETPLNDERETSVNTYDDLWFYTAIAGFSDAPKLATPALHNLMRSDPRDLSHQVARQMIDRGYFDENPSDIKLYRACYMASRAVETEEHFNAVMLGGLNIRFHHYTFDEYRVELVALSRRIRIMTTRFFADNTAVMRRLKLRAEPEKRDPKNVWARFYSVWDRLTKKQKVALEKVYMDPGERPTQKEVALCLGIAEDSLRDRLKVAIRRFKAELWEFEGMSPKHLSKAELKGSVDHNGMWRDQSAAIKHPLYKVDLSTGLRIEITWNKLPKSNEFDLKTVARIKAEIIENCPVPYILDHEYLDGMKPTIMSFGRRPGNLKYQATK